ncbi:MAG: hypothetical protein ACLR76_05495, partial [Alistipes sp.]
RRRGLAVLILLARFWRVGGKPATKADGKQGSTQSVKLSRSGCDPDRFPRPARIRTVCSGPPACTTQSR